MDVKTYTWDFSFDVKEFVAIQLTVRRAYVDFRVAQLGWSEQPTPFDEQVRRAAVALNALDPSGDDLGRQESVALTLHARKHE